MSRFIRSSTAVALAGLPCRHGRCRCQGSPGVRSRLQASGRPVRQGRRVGSDTRRGRPAHAAYGESYAPRYRVRLVRGRKDCNRCRQKRLRLASNTTLTWPNSLSAMCRPRTWRARHESFRRCLQGGFQQGDRGNDVSAARAQFEVAPDDPGHETRHARDIAPVHHGRLGAMRDGGGRPSHRRWIAAG